MSALLVGYARCSTDQHDLTAQRDGLLNLGVQTERIYVDHGLTGTNGERPGLREALAACRSGDTLVVTKLEVDACMRGVAVLGEGEDLLDHDCAGGVHAEQVRELCRGDPRIAERRRWRRSAEATSGEQMESGHTVLLVKDDDVASDLQVWWS